MNLIFNVGMTMNKKTTRYACLLAISRVSVILVNTLKDRIINVYMSDSYLSVKFHGLLTDDDVRKFNFCVGSIFGDFPIRPTWSINYENKQKDLDFTKADSELRLTLPSITDNI